MERISRRHFLYCSAGLLCTAMPARAFWPFSTKTVQAGGPVDIRGRVFRGDAPKKLWEWSHEGFLYKKSNNNRVVCGICPNRCVLAPGDRSICPSTFYAFSPDTNSTACRPPRFRPCSSSANWPWARGSAMSMLATWSILR